MITDAAEIEEALKGKAVTDVGIAQDDTSIEIYFNDGLCICIEGEALEIEVRQHES